MPPSWLHGGERVALGHPGGREGEGAAWTKEKTERLRGRDSEKQVEIREREEAKSK